MVVFTCNHCGETLHKPKVEKHYQFQCRNYKSVTCVDCFKDFRNEEYVQHTKCITEEERYAAKGTYKNGIVKKGEVKQETWLEMIKSICDTEKNLKPTIRKLLETISGYSNVPRKKVKFMNFIKSSSGNRANMLEVEEVWDIIERYKAKNAPSNQENQKSGTGNQNGTQAKEGINNISKRPHENEDHGETKKKKRKSSEEYQPAVDDSEAKEKQTVDETEALPKKKKNKQKLEKSPVADGGRSEESANNSLESKQFDYKATILGILTEKQTIAHKKLQKKIVKAYVSATGQNDCEERIIKKFNKKLKKIPNISIENDRVILTS